MYFMLPEQSRQAGDSVLVHCQAGISRSPALVIAYLMAHSGLSLRDAYRWVKSKRSVISPNFAFLGQLCDFEADLISGRVPRKPDTLDGLITLPEESHDVDDFLSLSIENYTSTRASSVESVDDATNATVSSMESTGS
ncbi:Dual specificity protein phosphatase 10 [Fasciola gigantica]|uniref:protein-tyrosine-phosphatase n=1 Tax=Fasciola gigantica TaxID=46835 RepID=A0A504YBC9_FASGI|nr:Dual specificity protein phosphatase 10 [Fasciola gigantica]